MAEATNAWPYCDNYYLGEGCEKNHKIIEGEIRCLQPEETVSPATL